MPLVTVKLGLRVIGDARCADISLDADQWFPISAEAGQARQEAAAAVGGLALNCGGDDHE